MSDDLLALMHFGGTARLFPLPNLVLYPHVLQPLHIFEPRYRQMTSDALDGDRLIALTLLQPGWEADYAGKPAIYPIACLGRIVAEQRLEDGRFNLLLRGLSRIQVVEEVPTDKLYRSARAELLYDANVPGAKADQKMRRRMGRLIRPWFAGQDKVRRHFRKLLQTDCPLGWLIDILAFSLPLDVAVKQELLEMLNVERRANYLLDHLQKHPGTKPAAEPGQRPFPPEFSVN